MPPGLPSAAGHPGPVRRVVGMVATLLTGVLGALIVGEYDLHGFTPYVSGILFGLVAAEVALAIGRDNGIGPAAVVAVAAAGGLAWAAWISSGRGVAPIPLGAWLGVGLAAVVGFGWVRYSGRRRPPPERDKRVS